MFLECMKPKSVYFDQDTDIQGRLDGMVPNTPRNGAPGNLNSSIKRKAGTMQTPSLARLKLEPQSSPPDFKSSPNFGDHGP